MNDGTNGGTHGGVIEGVSEGVSEGVEEGVSEGFRENPQGARESPPKGSRLSDAPTEAPNLAK